MAKREDNPPVTIRYGKQKEVIELKAAELGVSASRLLRAVWRAYIKKNPVKV